MGSTGSQRTQMRLFIGIELPDDLKQEAARVAERARATLENAAPRAVLRWVPVENLHITIWFIGDANENRATEIRDVMSPPFSVPPFELRLGGGGTFPHSGDPRAVWLGLIEGRERLVSVYDEVAVRLATLGYAPEKRPYSPHLTIARVKDVHRRDAAAIRRAASAAPADIAACHVRSATLFRSRTSPRGSEYEALLRVPLG
jgi:2'-5' RNA ligase